MKPFDLASYTEALKAFPNISFEEFQSIDDLAVRKDIVSKNKILQTDAYNRTMTYLRDGENDKEEVFTLTFRKASNQLFNVVYGVRNMVQRVLSKKFTKEELEFAKAAYKEQSRLGGTGYFDEKMWEDVINNDGYLPIEVRAVEDGTVLRPSEPVLSVKWPRELAAVFEPEYLRIFFQSAVATDARYIENLIGSGRVIEMGKRATPNEALHLDAVEALKVGANIEFTSNDAAAVAIPGVRASGTTAHRYFASYSTEDEGFENAIERSDKITLLVDLVDSYRGIDKIINLKRKYRNGGKTIFMRLDSGDLIDQAIYALRRQRAEWMIDPKQDKIVIADIESIAKIEEIESKVRSAGFNPEQFIGYGLGGLLVIRNKLRDTLSAAYKLTKTEEWVAGKFSNDAGKEAIPGELDLEIRPDGRYIVQADEEVRGERLLKTVYKNGEIFFKDASDIAALDSARKRIIESEKLLSLPTKKSARTTDRAERLRARYFEQTAEVLAA